MDLERNFSRPVEALHGKRLAAPRAPAAICAADEQASLWAARLEGGTLSAADREVIALRVILDLDATSAGRVLGISPTACTTRLARALEKLERNARSARVA